MIRTLLAMLAIMFCCRTAETQIVKGVPRVVQVLPVNVAGTLMGMRQNILSINSVDNKTWYLGITNKTKIKVQGTADVSTLKAGMSIRFSAEVDRRRSAVTEPISLLTIFSPSQEEDRQLGVFNANPAEWKSKKSGEEGAGAEEKAEGEAVGVKSDAPGGAAHGDSKNKSTANVEAYDISAQIVSIKGNKLQLTVPNNSFFKPKFTAELAEDCRIQLDLNTLAYAQVGDIVKAQGVQSMQNPTSMETISVTVQLAQTLGGSGAKAKSNAAANKNKNKGKNDKKEKDDDAKTEHGASGTGDKTSGGSNDAEGAKTPARQPAESKENAPELSQRAQKALAVIQLSPEELEGRPALSISYSESDEKELFLPTKQITVEKLREECGPPSTPPQPVKGKVSLDGKDREVDWQMLTYGKIRILVDEEKNVRFYALPKK